MNANNRPSERPTTTSENKGTVKHNTMNNNQQTSNQENRVNDTTNRGNTRPNNFNKDGGNRQGGYNRDNQNRDGGRQGGYNRDNQNRDGGNRQGGFNRDGGRQGGFNKDGGNRQGGFNRERNDSRGQGMRGGFGGQGGAMGGLSIPTSDRGGRGNDRRNDKDRSSKASMNTDRFSMDRSSKDRKKNDIRDDYDEIEMKMPKKGAFIKPAPVVKEEKTDEVLTIVIPEIITIKELADNILDYTPNANSEVVLLNSSDVTQGVFAKLPLVSNVNLKGQFKKRFQKGDILYSEIRPRNKHYAYCYFDSDRYIASTRLIVLRGKKEKIVSNTLLYQYLISQNVFEEFTLKTETRSGTFPQGNYQDLSSIVVPYSDNQREIAGVLDSIYKRIWHNNTEIETLATLRDTLLTKLMNGEIKI